MKTKKATHTPWPWVFEYRPGNSRGNKSSWGSVGLWGSNGELILGTGPGWEPEFVEPNKKDSALIATAPELLSALKQLLENPEHTGECLIESRKPRPYVPFGGGCLCGHAKAYHEANQAIAKAEGKPCA